MPKRQIRLEGITTTGLYLTVHFTTGEAAARRLEQVRIPWDRLLDTDVYQHLDKAEAKRLRAHWASQDEALPPW